MIYTALRAVMIYQACGLDKKRTKQKLRSFLAPPVGLDLHFLPSQGGRKTTPGKSKVSLTVRLTVAVPGGCPRRQSAFVPRRPLPLAPLPVSAPGGGRVAPYLLSYAQSVSQRPANSQFLDEKASRKAKKEAHLLVCFFFGSPCWT